MPSGHGAAKRGGISKPAPKSKVGLFRKALRLVVLLLLLALLSLLLPPVFRVALQQLIVLEGWRHGVEVQIGLVDGSLYEPVVLLRSRWTFHSRAGCLTRFEVTRAEAEFSWQELLPGHGHRWFRRLSLEGVLGKVQLPPVSPVGSPLRPAEEQQPAWYPAPTQVEAKDVDLLVQSEADFVHLEESRILISEQQPGVIEIGNFVVKQPFLTRTFRNIHGTTALQDGRVQIGELQLDPAVQVQSFSADVRQIARGRLDMDLQIEAFGGRIQAQAATIPHERGTELEASGNFYQIAIAPLATFLNITDAAGGNIKEGKFNFRGSPRDVMRSSLTLRLEATNFQWESRQWDSLTLGATLLDRRVQIPELELRQGHNQLSLNGDVALANGARPWWQSDFSLNIAARIENLTELSALLLPDFKYAAGRMSIDGSVRSKDQQYYGALIVSGSELTWRSAPIQELRAALRLAGKELQIANLDLLNKDDYLRGQGVFNLDDAHTYHGELRASVEDLATYAAILQKPLVPDSLAGGATLRWMGEGSPKGQSGRFFARLRHLRPLTPAPSRLHPVDAELEGSYAPASLRFSKLNIADESCALSVQGEVTARSVSFSELRLTHGSEVWLEGQGTLPLEMWGVWPEGQAPQFAEELPVKLQLKAIGLALGTAARLTGWNWPLGGLVNGEIAAEGKLGHLQGTGTIALKDGRFPFEGDSAVPTLFTGDFTLAGQTLSTTNLTLRKGDGHCGVQGQLDLASFRDPVLQAHLGSGGEEVVLPLFRGLPWQQASPDGGVVSLPLRVRLGLQPLTLAGPLSAATLAGTVGILGWEPGGSAELSALWREGTAPELPPVFVFPSLLSQWRLNLEAKGEKPESAQARWIYPQLHLGGTGGAPVLTGTVQFAGQPVQAGSLSLTIADGSLTFREGAPRDPTLDLHAIGLVDSLPVNAWLVGPLTRHLGFFDSETARAQALGASAAPAAFPPWARFSGETAPAPAKAP